MTLFHRLGLHVDVGQLVVRGGKIVVIIALAWIAYAVARRVIRSAVAAATARIEQESRRERITTVLLLINSVLRWVVIFLVTITVLDELGIDVRPVLAAAGVVGLAVGFGAQNLVRDVVSGFFIIMEGQYAVGDLVEINGVFGRVEQIGLRTTRLRQPNGQLRYFFNGTITSTNTYTTESIAYVLNVPLSASEQEVRGTVERALADFDAEFQVFSQPPEIRPAVELPSYAPVLKVDLRAIPGRHDIVQSKLPARLTAALARAGHPAPEGTEVSMALRYPAPGQSI